MEVGRCAVEHESSIGEYKAKISTTQQRSLIAEHNRTILTMIRTLVDLKADDRPGRRFLGYLSTRPCQISTF